MNAFYILGWGSLTVWSYLGVCGINIKKIENAWSRLRILLTNLYDFSRLQIYSVDYEHSLNQPCF